MTDTNRAKIPRWAELVGTFFGVGRIKRASGTWAAVATVGLWAIGASFVPPSQRWQVAVVCSLLITVIGVVASNAIVRGSGIKDPQFVVIDEVAGQLITLIGSPLTWPCLLVGLILFRIFDILKPPPIRQFESLPEGWGVMFDDVAAGAIGLLILQALVHFHVLR